LDKYSLAICLAQHVDERNKIIFFCAKSNLANMRINSALFFVSCTPLLTRGEVAKNQKHFLKADGDDDQQPRGDSNAVIVQESFPEGMIVPDAAKQITTRVEDKDNDEVAQATTVEPIESILPTDGQPSPSSLKAVTNDREVVIPHRRRVFRAASNDQITSRLSSVSRQPVMHETQVHNVYVPVKPTLRIRDRRRLRRAIRYAARDCFEGKNCANVKSVDASKSA